jgi:hypothetical protein
MRTTLRFLTAVTLVGFGYALGTMQSFHPQTVKAQAVADTPEGKIKEAYRSLDAAQQMLVNNGQYRPAINGVNTFAVTAGGVDAVRDLEEGTGVDPETFAGLYAGQATDAVAARLKTDDKGRLTYDKKVVRMYSIERLKKMFRRRAEIAGLKDALGGLGPVKQRPKKAVIKKN